MYTGPATSDTAPGSTVGMNHPGIPMLPPIPCAGAWVIQTLDSHGETSYTTPVDEQLRSEKVAVIQYHTVDVPSSPAFHVQEMPSRSSAVSVHVQQMPARQSGGPTLPAGPATRYKP